MHFSFFSTSLCLISIVIADAVPSPYELASTAAAWEATQHADNEFSFYNVPNNFSQTLEPGVLLRVETETPLTNYTVPGGLTMSRILYTTTNPNGTVLPTAAYILWPYTTPPKNGYPLVAWAHGTSGYFKPCAPSNYRSLQYHFMVPYLLALQGNVVVAPDYAGLGVDTLPDGTKIPHLWLTPPAQANDLANAILAARAGFPQYLPEKGPFVAMGHSQGGATAWSFAERLVHAPIAGYRGTLALAPPTSFFEEYARIQKNSSVVYAFGVLAAQPQIISSVTRNFPAYNDSGMTDETYDLWHNALEKVQGCLPTDTLVFAQSNFTSLAKPGWTEDPLVQEFANLSAVGKRAIKGPLLVLQGEEDEAVASEVVRETAEMTCGVNEDEAVEFVSYQAMDHFSVIQASQQKWLAWVRERLACEEPAPAGCSISAVKGFRTEATVKGAAPNFLVTWAGLTEFWKYVL